MTDPLADLYRQQRDLEKLIAEKKRRREQGWAEMVQQHTDELNDTIRFRDAITTSLGGLNRNRGPAHDLEACRGR